MDSVNKLLSWLDAERFGFDWADGDGCHVQVTRTATVRWKGRNYRYLEVKTEKEVVEIRVAPGGSLRVFRKHKELN